MMLPRESLPAPVLLTTYGLYLTARLKLEPELADLLEALTAASDSLHQAYERSETARKTQVNHLAARNRSDLTLDSLVRRFHALAKARGHVGMAASLYKKYFPDGLETVIRDALVVELEKVSALIAVLSDETDSVVFAFLPPFQEALAAATAAHAAVEEGREAACAELELLRQEKRQFVETYRRIFRELSNRLGSYAAEAFLRDVRESRMEEHCAQES